MLRPRVPRSQGQAGFGNPLPPSASFQTGGRGGEHLSRHFRADTSRVVMLRCENAPTLGGAASSGPGASLQSLQEHNSQQCSGETKSLLVSFLKIL